MLVTSLAGLGRLEAEHLSHPLRQALDIRRPPTAPLATLVRRPDAGAASLVGNVIWFILAGWWLAIGHLVTGVLMCISIIGIPLGVANFKLIPVSLTPLGRDIVDFDQARRLGYDTQVAIPTHPSRRASDTAPSRPRLHDLGERAANGRAPSAVLLRASSGGRGLARAQEF